MFDGIVLLKTVLLYNHLCFTKRVYSSGCKYTSELIVLE